MKYLEQKPGHFWWKQNHRYTLYIIREFSSVLILIGLISIIANVIDNKISGTKVMTLSPLDTLLGYIGLFGAIIHSLTWLYVMPKISPIPLPKTVQIVSYFFLIIATGTLTVLGIFTLMK
jgi:fumarate reductase subunit C